MTRKRSRRWRLDRRISLSVLVQIAVLASLTLGSWINLQRRLEGVQHDVNSLLQSREDSQHRLELLWEQSINHEYRLRAMEGILSANTNSQ